MLSRLHMSNKLHFLIGLILICPILVHSQLPTISVDLGKYSWQCKLAVAEKIGWKIEPTSEKFVVEAPSKCEVSNSANLDLRLKIDLSDADAEKIQGTIHSAVNQALLSPGTNCAFQTRLTLASKSAAQQLRRNLLYIFTPFWADENDDLRMGTLKQFWQPHACAGHCASPRAGQTTNAVQGLYNSIYSTDCGVGLELVEFSTIKELFGDAGFEKNFSADEIVIGDIKALSTTTSFVRGKNLKAVSILPPNGIAYARAGSQTFIGISGYIGSVPGKDYFIDDTVNANENFMIVHSTQSGANTFLKNGGLAYYEKYLKLAWETSRGLTKEELQSIEHVAVLNLLKKANGITLQNYMPKESGQIVSDRADDFLNLLKDPFLSETQVYVHPVGVKSMAWHIARLARLNPRSPYEIVFYPDVMHSGVYDRWMKSQLDDCEARK